MAEPGCGPLDRLPDPEYPPGYDFEIHGPALHELTIERDIWEDDNEGIVPLKTNLNELPPHWKPYPANDFSDRIRYNEWEAEEEKKFYMPIKIEVDKQNVIDNFGWGYFKKQTILYNNCTLNEKLTIYDCFSSPYSTMYGGDLDTSRNSSQSQLVTEFSKDMFKPQAPTIPPMQQVRETFSFKFHH